LAIVVQLLIKLYAVLIVLRTVYVCNVCVEAWFTVTSELMTCCTYLFVDGCRVWEPDYITVGGKGTRSARTCFPAWTWRRFV